MRKKNFNKREAVTMDEVRKFGYCEHCGEEITDENEEYYVTEDGKVFCCAECVLAYYCVVKVEV